MKMRNPISVFLAGAAIAIGLGAQAQNTVTLTGGTSATCTYTAVSAGLNGVFSFTCGGAATVAPTCTLTANPNPVSPGGSSTLTASCSPGPITAGSYVWSVSPSGPATPSTSASFGTILFPTAGNYSYTVRASNAIGQGAVSDPVVIAVVAPTNPPVCTNTTATATTGGSATITASCTNGPTSYAWTPPTTPAGAPAMPAQATALIGPFPTAGTYVYNLTTASNGIAPDGTATATVTVTDPVGNNCTTTATKLIENPYLLQTDVQLNRGPTTAALKFTTPLNPGQTKQTITASSGPASPLRNDVQAVVSTCPGDFTNAAKSVNPTTGVVGADCKAHWTYQGGTLYCTLPAGTYYLNVRHVRLPLANPPADSCGALSQPVPYGYCAHYIGIQ